MGLRLKIRFSAKIEHNDTALAAKVVFAHLWVSQNRGFQRFAIKLSGLLLGSMVASGAGCPVANQDILPNQYVS